MAVRGTERGAQQESCMPKPPQEHAERAAGMNNGMPGGAVIGCARLTAIAEHAPWRRRYKRVR